jgi:hypothetical protein
MDDGIPTIFVIKRLSQFVFKCTECGKDHYHGAAREGHRESHCRSPGAFPLGYNLKLVEAHAGLKELDKRLLDRSQAKAHSEADLVNIEKRRSELQDIRLAFWEELNQLAGKTLPDPGCRPDAAEVFAYREHPPAYRDFTKALGYLHRILEYVERLEEKCGCEDFV